MNPKSESRTFVVMLAGMGLLFATGRADAADVVLTDNLTISTGNNPKLRLNQTNAQGYAPFIWDIRGNESYFSIINASDGKIPFWIWSAAPSDSIVIGPTGNIGFGTPYPAAPHHVIKVAEVATAETLAVYQVGDDPVGRLEISNNSTTDGIFHPRLQGKAASQATPLSLEGHIGLDVGTNPVFSFNAIKGSGAVVNRSLVAFRNNITIKARIAANGDMFATSFNPTSSRTMKDNIVDLDLRTAVDALGQLVPVTFVYKDDPTAERRVGFIAEDVPEIVANADRQSVPIMDVVALVARVVKGQEATIDDQRKSIADQNRVIAVQKQFIADQKQLNESQKQLNDELMKRLVRLESRMRD